MKMRSTKGFVGRRSDGRARSTLARLEDDDFQAEQVSRRYRNMSKDDVAQGSRR